MKTKKYDYGALLLVLLENKIIFIFFAGLVISHMIDITIILNSPEALSSWYSFLPEAILVVLGLRQFILWLLRVRVKNLENFNEKKLTKS